MLSCMTVSDSIWLRSDSGRPGPRPTYTLDQLADACVRIADEDGIRALSMRRLADTLGTAPASLYRYVSGKTDLVDLMVDRAGAEYRFAPLTGDVRADVLDIAEQSRAIHRRHPWLSQVTASTLGPNSMRYLDHLVGALAPAGLDPTATMTGVALLSGWVTNFAAQEAAGMSAGAAGGGAAHIAAMLEHGDYPHLTALMTDAAAGGSAGDVADADSRSGADDGSDANDRAFRAGIDALLFGIAPTR